MLPTPKAISGVARVFLSTRARVPNRQEYARHPPPNTESINPVGSRSRCGCGFGAGTNVRGTRRYGVTTSPTTALGSLSDASHHDQAGPEGGRMLALLQRRGR